MARTLKYLNGPLIGSMDELAKHIEAGGYLIVASTGQRVHPSWASSWQFRMCWNAIKRGGLRKARPNPEHPDHKEIQE